MQRLEVATHESYLIRSLRYDVRGSKFSSKYLTAWVHQPATLLTSNQLQSFAV